MTRVGQDSVKVQSIEAPIGDQTKIQRSGTPTADLWQAGSTDATSEVRWRVHSTALDYIRDASRMLRRYNFDMHGFGDWLTKLVDKLLQDGSPQERQAVYQALTENWVGRAGTKALLIVGAPIGWGVLAIFGPSGSGVREYNYFVREAFRKDRFMHEQAARLAMR